MRQTPQETLGELCRLFPSFEDWWKREEDAPLEDGLVDGVYYEWTHHRIMSEFLSYLASAQQSCSAPQLRSLGEWLDQAVSEDDQLANAVSTCFLEHLRQVKINRLLAPHLSARVKGKSNV